MSAFVISSHFCSRCSSSAPRRSTSALSPAIRESHRPIAGAHAIIAGTVGQPGFTKMMREQFGLSSGKAIQRGIEDIEIAQLVVLFR